MKVIEIAGAFGVKNLQFGVRPQPSPGPGEVLLQMRAASLNYRDLLMVTGRYNPRQSLPLIPCSDGVGHVVALGEGVDPGWLGQRACPLFAGGWYDGDPTPQTLLHTRGGPLDGTLAEYMAVPVADLVVPPAHWTDAEAACLPCAYLTAWSALDTLGAVPPGAWVLIQGTGGVALAALQLARLRGARVIQTSSSDEKCARVTALGAEATLNYRRTPDWGRVARDLASAHGGVDHIIELGGAGTLAQSLRAVRPGGTLSLIGILGGGQLPLDVTAILMRQIRVQGVFVGHRAGLRALCAALTEAPSVRPIIDRTVSLAEAPEAIASLSEGAHFGKITVQIG